MDLFRIMLIAVGGSLGSVARYVMARQVDQRLTSVMPYGTLVVNLVGAFLIGVVYTLATRKAGFTEHWRLFLGAGFCGGFTTFSAFAWENWTLLDQKMAGTSLIYIVMSLAGGILSVLFGVWVARFL